MNTDHHVSEQLTAEQYRARAHFARCTAEEMTRETMRRQLLRLAEEYEVLADRLEQETRIGVDQRLVGEASERFVCEDYRHKHSLNRLDNARSQVTDRG
jgi:hypothetical protein